MTRRDIVLSDVPAFGPFLAAEVVARSYFSDDLASGRQLLTEGQTSVRYLGAPEAWRRHDESVSDVTNELLKAVLGGRVRGGG